MPPAVLLTGFEPYVEGLDVNPTWEIVRPLAGTRVAGFEVHVARLPVAYGAARDALVAALERSRPRALVSFGMQQRSAAVELEERFRYAERTGEELATDERTEPGRAPERATTLPVAAVLSHLQAAGYAARASRDAGLFVCEHVGFCALGLRAARGLGPVGFVHVPAPDALSIERQLGIPRAVLEALHAAAAP